MGDNTFGLCRRAKKNAIAFVAFSLLMLAWIEKEQDFKLSPTFRYWASDSRDVMWDYYHCCVCVENTAKNGRLISWKLLLLHRVWTFIPLSTAATSTSLLTYIHTHAFKLNACINEKTPCYPMYYSLEGLCCCSRASLSVTHTYVEHLSYVIHLRLTPTLLLLILLLLLL